MDQKYVHVQDKKTERGMRSANKVWEAHNGTFSRKPEFFPRWIGDAFDGVLNIIWYILQGTSICYRLDFVAEGDFEAEGGFFEGDDFADLGVLFPPELGCRDAGDLEDEGVWADDEAEESLVGVEEALEGRVAEFPLLEAEAFEWRGVTSSNSVFAISVIEETTRGSTRGLESHALR